MQSGPDWIRTPHIQMQRNLADEIQYESKWEFFPFERWIHHSRAEMVPLNSLR